MTKSLPTFSWRDGIDREAMHQAYDRDGCVILDGFADQKTCDGLMERAGQLIEDYSPDDMATVFSTLTQEHTRDSYFRNSGDKIRFFLEEEACDQKGKLRVSKERAINKIGHALHDLDTVFDAFSHGKDFKDLALTLGFSEPLLLQSMFIFKQPGIGGEVTCHQDATFLYTEPQSVTGFWLALEDATLENGCLWVLPGRHHAGIKFRFHDVNGTLKMETLDQSPWPEADKVALEVTAGTLVVLHGQLPHLSGANRSQQSRRAYVIHMIDGQCHYPTDNWLQRSPDMPLRGFN